MYPKLVFITFFCLLSFGLRAQDTLYAISADSVINLAKKYLGTGYKFAGKEPSGFDCSGYVGFVFGQFDISLPSSSFDMVSLGKEISLDEVKRGDLIFFKGFDKAGPVGHVGLVVSTTKKIKWIHASSSKGVRYDTFDNLYFKERFVTIKRIIK